MFPSVPGSSPVRCPLARCCDRQLSSPHVELVRIERVARVRCAPSPKAGRWPLHAVAVGSGWERRNAAIEREAAR